MTRTVPRFAHEQAAIERGARFVIGVDEVGRGPLAGPVTAAAVRLDPGNIPGGLADSKQLTRRQRERLSDWLWCNARCAVAHAGVAEIDRLNILRASHLAMARAAAALPADFALVDGRWVPGGLACPGRAIVRGDASCLSIAAASIVAKVARDALMAALDREFPGYGWAHNAGYPTPEHRRALDLLGVSPAHRRSFKPVHNILYQDASITP